MRYPCSMAKTKRKRRADFRNLSAQNGDFATEAITLANGLVVNVLDMSSEEADAAQGVLYLHVHSKSRRAYVGVTSQPAGSRWLGGKGYMANPRFWNSIRRHGWPAFKSYIVAFADTREALNLAEKKLIRLAGGHKSNDTFNASPGGEIVADNAVPIIGCDLATGEERQFSSGTEAARMLGLTNVDNPMAVIRGEQVSAGGWWFRLEDDNTSQPPTQWGEEVRLGRLRDVRARGVVAIHWRTGEELLFGSMTDAAHELGVAQSEVSAVALGHTHSAGGWWFRLTGDNRAMPHAMGTEATRQKRDVTMYAVSLSNGEHREFRNSTVADTALQLFRGASSAVARGERASAGGWWFTHDDEASPPALTGSALVAKARSKPVIAISIEIGNETHFESAKAAAKSLGLHRSAISRVLSGKASSTQGFAFKFAQILGDD
jgi:hypothetical protein